MPGAGPKHSRVSVLGGGYYFNSHFAEAWQLVRVEQEMEPRPGPTGLTTVSPHLTDQDFPALTHLSQADPPECQTEARRAFFLQSLLSSRAPKPPSYGVPALLCRAFDGPSLPRMLGILSQFPPLSLKQSPEQGGEGLCLPINLR